MFHDTTMVGIQLKTYFPEYPTIVHYFPIFPTILGYSIISWEIANRVSRSACNPQLSSVGQTNFDMTKRHTLPFQINLHIRLFATLAGTAIVLL